MAYKHTAYYKLASEYLAARPDDKFKTKREAAETIAATQSEVFSDTQIRRLATEVGRVLAEQEKVADVVADPTPKDEVISKTDKAQKNSDSMTVAEIGEAVESIKSEKKMQSVVTADEEGKPIALSVTFLDDGSSFTSRSTDRYFNAALTAAHGDNLDAMEAVINPAKKAAAFTSSYKEIEIRDGEITFSKTPIRGKLVDHILNCIGFDKPIDALIKALHKLQANPNPNVRRHLWAFADRNNLGVTEDGDFMFYKHVDHDYWSWYTHGKNPAQVASIENPDQVFEVESGRIPYLNGTVVTQDRKFVDPDPDRGCSHGLHVGAYGYHIWSNCRTLVVTVDPQDVVAVPHNNSLALRVCKMTVVGELTTVKSALEHDDVIFNDYLTDKDGVTLDQSRTNVFWCIQKDEPVAEESETTEEAYLDPNEGVVKRSPLATFVKEVLSGEHKLTRWLKPNKST